MSPGMCPYCRSFDVRTLTAVGHGPAGYRCHDCQKTFYVTPAATMPSAGSDTGTKGGGDGLRVRNSGVVRVFVHDTPTHWVTADSTITVCNGAWRHLVGQYDNSNGQIELYIDGVPRASASATGISYTTGIHDLFIGHEFRGHG
jgi:hypothetical protein